MKQSICCQVLLAVFVTGGVLMPLVHRAQHGQLSDQQNPSASAACDHRQHGSSFEDFFSDVVDDDCRLCVRLLHFGAPQVVLQALLGFSPLRTGSFVVENVPSAYFSSIRGPPGAA